MGVSRTLWRTGAAPISRAVGRRETRTRHSVRHNGETCECHLPVPLSHPAVETNHTPSLSLSTIISLLSTVLYYTVLPCPVLCPCPHTQTHMHTYVFGTAWFLAACVLDTHTTSSPTSRHRFSRSNVWAAAASPQPRLHWAALHGTGCTALAPQAWIGLDGGVGLGCRASERAKRLSYCAARLASLSISHHCILSTVHFQISTHWVPPSIPTRLSTPPPRTKRRHLLSSSLSSPPRNASLGNLTIPHRISPALNRSCYQRISGMHHAANF